MSSLWRAYADQENSSETTTRDWHIPKDKLNLHPSTVKKAKSLCDKYMLANGLIVITETELAKHWKIAKRNAVRDINNMVDQGLFKPVVICNSYGEHTPISKGVIQVMLSPEINQIISYWDDLQRIAWLREQWAVAAMIDYKEWFKLRGEKHTKKVRSKNKARSS